MEQFINHPYKDTGLFGISASVHRDRGTHAHVAPVICEQIFQCTQRCTQEELERARNQLKSSLLMSLESQPVQLEDLGRQILAYGKRMDVVEMCKRIDAVEIEDIIRVGRIVFAGEGTDSRFHYDDGICKPWVRTGPWEPSVLVQGQLYGSRDPLHKVDQAMSKWGLMARKRAGSIFARM